MNYAKTNIEFHDKHGDLLEQGHYGLEINDSEVVAFLDRLFQELKADEIRFTYSQIKIKYGGARFYSSLPVALNEAIESKINEILKSQDG